MKKTNKLLRQTISFAAIAALTILFAPPTSVAAQNLTQNTRSAFNHLFQTFPNHNLWLSGAANVTENIAPNILPGENPAQDDNLPTPDFSAMSEWYEIRKWEYDLYSQTGAKMNLIIVAKKESRPKMWDLISKDADDVTVAPLGQVLISGSTIIHPMVVNEPYKCSFPFPEEKVLKRVKTMRAVQRN